MKKTIIQLAFLVAILTPSQAEISMPAFFSDGMVLQQKSNAKLWGWAESGDEVVAHFSGKKSTATAGANGQWVIELGNLQGSTEGKELTIKVGEHSKTIKDVVVGEVWIASGQSNMEWTVNKTKDAEEDSKAEDNLLRVYVTSNETAAEPKKDFPGKWQSAQPENTPGFTAVGYHFAKSLRKKLDVPVGIIECAWGGKRIEAFISDPAMKEAKDLEYLVEAKAAALRGFNPEAAKKRYEQGTERWKTRFAEWEKTKQGRRPVKPQMPQGPSLSPRLHSTIYNAMIAPVAGYSAKGAIWYQGESNTRDESANDYKELLKLLIKDWQKQWQSDLSFYYVQLASFKREPAEGWVIVQDEMRQLLSDPEMEKTNLGMAVIHDIGHPSNIHPENKQDVGKRLARWALHQDYGFKEIVVSGPLYSSNKISGSTITVNFDHAKGLATSDDISPGAFELMDAEGNWHPANAEIKGNTVILQSDQVKAPTQARYAWDCLATGANLINAEGLPTSCFTTN